jgi:hypothetical protein
VAEAEAAEHSRIAAVGAATTWSDRDGAPRSGPATLGGLAPVAASQEECVITTRPSPPHVTAAFFIQIIHALSLLLLSECLRARLQLH